jgi:uncharacterized protein YndB with AHSA1/START domain
MSTETQTFKFEQTVKTSPALVYYAFTNSTALREWFCDMATTAPHPGGHLYLRWNSGFFVTGEFKALEPEKTIAFTWHGRKEPWETHVEVALSKHNGETHILVVHSGAGTGEEWAGILKEIQSGWKASLENLASVLETGADLRFVRRPMLGIMVGEFNPEIAKKLDMPIQEGIKLDNVIDGMGAQAAGLQKDDVVIGMAGHPVSDYPSLAVALQGQHGGDKVEVVFYRGNEKKTVIMELSRRPLPEFPDSAEALAEILGKRYAEQDEALAELFEGVSETEASYQPAPGEWSAKENLAHLIHSERGWHTWISDLANGQEPHYDDFGGNLRARVTATAAVYPTTGELLDELKRNCAETVGTISKLPEEFMARKASFWRLCYNLLETPFHFNDHSEQMRAAIEAAQSQ